MLVVSSTCRASVEGNRVDDSVAEDSGVGEGEGEGVGDLVGEEAVTPDFLMPAPEPKCLLDSRMVGPLRSSVLVPIIIKRLEIGKR